MAAASAIRFVIVLAEGDHGAGEIRHQFVHACDLTPTLLDLVGIKCARRDRRRPQMPIEGESFARSITEPPAPSKNAAIF